MTISHPFLILMTMIVLSSTDQVFHRIRCNLGLSGIFLMVRLGLQDLGKKTMAHYGISRMHAISVIYQEVNLDHLSEIVFVNLFHCNVTFFPLFPYCTLRKQVTKCISHLRGRDAPSP